MANTQTQIRNGSSVDFSIFSKPNPEINRLEVIIKSFFSKLNAKIDGISADFIAELEGLKQTTSVKVYYDEFKRITSKMQLSSDYMLYSFMAGLEEEIRCHVNMCSPKTIHDAYYAALIHEFTIRESKNEVAHKVFDEMPKGNSNVNNFVKKPVSECNINKINGIASKVVKGVEKNENNTDMEESELEFKGMDEHGNVVEVGLIEHEKIGQPSNDLAVTKIIEWKPGLNAIEWKPGLNFWSNKKGRKSHHDLNKTGDVSRIEMFGGDKSKMKEKGIIKMVNPTSAMDIDISSETKMVALLLNQPMHDQLLVKGNLIREKKTGHPDCDVTVEDFEWKPGLKFWSTFIEAIKNSYRVVNFASMPNAMTKHDSGFKKINVSLKPLSQREQTMIINVAFRNSMGIVTEISLTRIHISSLLTELKNKHAQSFELSDVGNIVRFKRDHYESQVIQHMLETTIEEKNLIFFEIIPHARSLVTDVSRNYVIQKCLEHDNQGHKKELVSQLVGQVLACSIQMNGCRVIQRELEVIDVDQQHKQLIGELDKYYAEAKEHKKEVVDTNKTLKLQEGEKHENSFTREENKKIIKYPCDDESDLKDDNGRLEKLNMEAKTSEMKVLKSDCLLKDKEIKSQNSPMSNMKIVKNQSTGGLQVIQSESTIIFESLEKAKNDMVGLVAELMWEKLRNYIIQKHVSLYNDNQSKLILCQVIGAPSEVILILSPYGTKATKKLMDNLKPSNQIMIKLLNCEVDNWFEVATCRSRNDQLSSYMTAKVIIDKLVGSYEIVSKEIIDRIIVNMRSDDAKDRGWNLFDLDYEANSPSNVISNRLQLPKEVKQMEVKFTLDMEALLLFSEIDFADLFNRKPGHKKFNNHGQMCITYHVKKLMINNRNETVKRWLVKWKEKDAIHCLDPWGQGSFEEEGIVMCLNNSKGQLDISTSLGTSYVTLRILAIYFYCNDCTKNVE